MTESTPSPILNVSGLSKRFPLERGLLRTLGDWWRGRAPECVEALSHVDLQVLPQETVGILGESGSGKSTLARLLMGLYAPDGGRATFEGRDLFSSDHTIRLQNLRQMQMIFQDPFGSLDPRMTVRALLEEPLRVHRTVPRGEWNERLVRGLAEVGLEPEALDRYPAEFSGGQRQRIGICRALVLDPSLLIADEAVSALDVSVQAQILELLSRLKAARRLSLLFISHDVAVVRQLADRILVLYQGRLVESMPADCLLQDAAHPYTRRLLGAALELRENGRSVTEAADMAVKDDGCPCRSLCSAFQPVCEKRPVLEELHPGHRVACWRPTSL